MPWSDSSKFNVGDKVRDEDFIGGVITRPHDDEGVWWVMWADEAPIGIRNQELYTRECNLKLVEAVAPPLTKLEAAKKALEILEEAGFGYYDEPSRNVRDYVRVSERRAAEARRKALYTELGGTDCETYLPADNSPMGKAIDRIIELEDAAK